MNLITLFTLIIFLLDDTFSSMQDATSQYNYNQIVSPIITDKYDRPIRYNLKFFNCSEAAFFKINDHNKIIKARLQENKFLIPNHYSEIYHFNDSFVTEKLHQVQREMSCHYIGSLVNDENSLVAISIINKKIEGVIYDANETYHIHHNNNEHILFKQSLYKNPTMFRCGFKDNVISPFVRKERSIFQPYMENPKTRYVELFIVIDNKLFLTHNKNLAAIFERTKKIANIVNALYNQLDIFIALVGVEIWSDKDEINISDDGDKTLSDFLMYRKEKLLRKYPNDNAQLISGVSFNNGVVGKAFKGPICTDSYSGGINTDHSYLIGLVAATVAHELGHNFGMEHDTANCSCPDERCIMAGASSNISPRKWSSCSKERLAASFSRGMDHCLKNKPTRLFGPVCGNGFLEEGEECDCGLEGFEFCNKCCDAKTCKLRDGASCGTGTCCNIENCSLVSTKKICRSAKSKCDIPEYCDGKSEFCPSDIWVHDGTKCKNDAYCWNGDCTSHDDQCKKIWGHNGQVSDKFCFKNNIYGDQRGHCGYSWVGQKYKKCRQSDTFCGLLHCTSTTKEIKYGFSESTKIGNITFLSDKVSTCLWALIDLGANSLDAGMVPNGAQCGIDKMCLNSTCVDVFSVRKVNGCVEDCNGNGFCDNRGLCHCIDGFIEPYCEAPLPKGYHFTLALHIIFLCILPLTAFAGFIVYYFHPNIKNWWVIKARKAFIKTSAKHGLPRKRPKCPQEIDLRSLGISNPIPIDNTNNKLIPVVTEVKSFQNQKRSEPSKDASSSNSKKLPVIRPIRSAPPPPPPPPVPAHRIDVEIKPKASSRLPKSYNNVLANEISLANTNEKERLNFSEARLAFVQELDKDLSKRLQKNQSRINI